MDFLGFFYSTDLDERLSSKNNFIFLTEADRETDFSAEYSFLVFTDTHIEDEKAHGLEKIIDVIREDKTIRFAVHLGDVTNNGKRQDIEKFLEIAEAMRQEGVTCYPIIGNHDLFSGNWPWWKNSIGSTSYRINGKGTTLFILDSANLYLGKTQLDWLEKEIKLTSGRIFVFTHCPIFAQELLNVPIMTDMKEKIRLLSILNNKCDIMFTGHQHRRFTSSAGDIQFIGIEDFKKNKTYCHVKVSPSGITYEFKRIK